MKYIAFLRGINVGKIRISMKDLKQCIEDLGFSEVKTYLNTGNVIFENDKNISEIKNELESKLSKRFNYEAFVLIYKHEILQDIISNYPFQRDSENHAYAIFVENNEILNELSNIAAEINNESKNIKTSENVIYWKVLKGSSLDTNFSKVIAKPKYKSTTTVRNINTLEKMV